MIRVVGFARTFQSAEVTGDIAEKAGLFVDDLVVRTVRMIENGELLPVAVCDLIQKKVAILNVWLCGNIIFDDCGIRNGNHVVKAEQAKTPAVEFQNMLARLQLCVVGLRGLHGNEITETSDSQHNTDIRTALAFVEWNAGVTGMKKGNIMFADMADKKVLQNSTFPGKKKRDCGSLAFSCP